MARTISSPPATEPVSLDDAKAHLRVTDTTDNDYITALITAARVWCERQTKRAFITQTWDVALGAFEQEIILTPAPLQSVSYVKYYDTNGTLQTLSSSVYQVDTTDCVGRIRLAYNQSWPDIRSGLYNGVQVRYVAGYGSSTSDVPANIKHAIKLMISHWYEVREPVIIGAPVNEVPMSVESLLNLDKVLELY